MAFWDKVKKDVSKGFKDSMNAISKTAEGLSEEGKRRYKIFDLKSKVHKDMAELGGKVYEIHKKSKNPMTDKNVQRILSRIKKYEAQIKKLDKKPANK